MAVGAMAVVARVLALLLLVRGSCDALAMRSPLSLGRSVHHPPTLSPLRTPLLPRVGRLSPLISPLMLLGDDDVRELPSDALLKAVSRTDGRVSAADVATSAGLDLLETRRQLLLLARLLGAELEVSESGELVYRFDGNVYSKLRSASFRGRLRDAWASASPALFWLLRASFGIALLSSVAIAFTGITVLSQQVRVQKSPSRRSLTLKPHSKASLQSLAPKPRSKKSLAPKSLQKRSHSQMCISKKSSPPPTPRPSRVPAIPRVGRAPRR